MQRVYMHSTEHFEVFTTVLAPQGRCRYRAEAEMMAVVHSYKPQWPDEVELLAGDVILVLSKHEEERWFGRLQGGQRGYFPASCVMELSQVSLPLKARRRSSSLRNPACDGDSGVHLQNRSGQAVRRGGGGGGGWDSKNEDPIQTRRPQIAALSSLASQPPQAHRSPGCCTESCPSAGERANAREPPMGPSRVTERGSSLSQGGGGGFALMEMCREIKSPKNHQV